MSDRVEAVLRMFRHEGGWRVEIRETTPHRPGSRAFATAEAHDITDALNMAVPYLRSLSEPDPFARMIGPDLEEIEIPPGWDPRR